MLEERYLRQLDVVQPIDFPPILLVGAGGIGSFSALALTKLGVRMLHVIDDDRVEEHNLPNQLYGESNLKADKVEALASICSELSDIEIASIVGRITENSNISESIVISGVDSMSARKDIWNSVKTNLKDSGSIKYYIDARMGLEVIRLYTVDLSKPIEWYESTLYSDSEAEMAPCTSKAIIYTGFIIAGLIANQVKKLVKNEEYVNDITFDVKNLMIVV